jgi:hypothetical protein
MATTYWQNKHSQALILPTKEGTSITIPQAGYVKDESGTYYSASFGLTSVGNPGSVIYAYTYPADPVDQVGVPGGSPGQIQYNNAGAFGGVSIISLANDSFNVTTPAGGIGFTVGGVGESIISTVETDTKSSTISQGIGSITTTIASESATTTETKSTTLSSLSLASGDYTTIIEAGFTSIELSHGTTGVNRNSITLDASGITLSSLAQVILPTLAVYADNAAAISGGLTSDMLYKTATGELRIVV